jgi:hypothetical protein
MLQPAPRLIPAGISQRYLKSALALVGQDFISLYCPKLMQRQFILWTRARAQARERGEGGPRAHKQKKVDKQEKLYIMGYYEN